ncbi:oxidoreductase [Christiangramia fulva]|uniref:NADH-quinone oxidoreductase subunit N n=1 Tax=Christiangramia fulva TaxID=2126553 RepID=A0A2R3Z8E7_9FLAO|nr:NADH-quinone oxidoreductase subunit N [Christiangramia fulva]AVR46548.1 oxidoreductase [Christiangramia fulva]
MIKDLLSILPQIIVLLTAMASLIFEMLRKASGSLITLIIGLAGASGLAISRLGTVGTAFSKTFRIDDLSLWAVIILCGTGILSALLMRQELKGTNREGTLYSLVAFSTLGSLLLAGSGDLMFLVLGVLINSLGGFAMAAYPKTDKATEGAIKYFVYGSVTGAVMLFGLTYWVGITGTTFIKDLTGITSQAFVLLIGFGGLITGLGYAASLFPFHFWTPDTFEGAPVSVAAFLSVTPKIGAFFALAQVMKDLPPLLDWNLILGILAVLSMTFGNIVALWQKNMLRLMAYSTVAQAGYFLLGIVAINQSGLALSGLIIFSLAYAAMNIGAFAVIQRTGNNIIYFEGLARKRPFMAVAMLVFLLSLVGIPPLAGFAGKFLLFGSAMDAGYTWLAVAAILNSVISLAVYLRIIFPMFYRKEPIYSFPTSGIITSVFTVCFIVTVLVGILLRFLV